MPGIKFIIILMVLQLFCGCGDEFTHWPRADFDKNQWQKTAEKDRYVFVRSLIERKMLNGFTHEQVFEFLGKPSFEDVSKHYQTYVIRADAGSIFLLDVRFESRGEQSVVVKTFVRVD